ncbi:protein kinase [Heterostelium album PN500]|uniref:non-specific serine/threonine protein kinase n=1 Tax=Heterostelium pallidum (strain ATCC 26659 / Pp 5 / PN500) TaxID=670386 RepID=D3B9Q5_HETP5|nr:protein kinase [Heterostelium album PN500]EFA81967.1 protein kinase [Heterostelium album PN500]|eukprot:XP_020434084.1 protein kinase [Heterostelium album PN500]
MTYVDYGGKYINCPFNCTVNATSFACSPDENGQTRGDWNDGKQTFQDPLPVGSTLKAVGFELLGTFNCASDSSVKTQLLILLQGEEIGNIFTVSAESTCMCANCYTNVTIPSYPVIVPLYNYSGINMLSINVMKNGICLFNVRTFLYYSLPAPITTATSSATATTSTASTSTTGGLTTTATTSSGPSTTGGGKNTPKGGLTTKQWAIIASSVTGGALVFILLFVYVRQKIARVGYVELKEGKNIDIGEIKLGERIGKGNFGEVFKGHWRGAVVAIKKLPAHNITETVMKEFHREIDLMKNLRHPNVIQFLGSCTIPPNICICTEYMPKGSLYGILHDPSVVIQWSLLKKMCMDAAKGIIYLHNSNPVILHRDLKSHNLLVDENFKVKVADFGLSTIEQTATMTACGTPCWTAPEVLRNQRYTEKADVYSFGIVMWECATRSDPYSGMPPFQVIFAVGREGLRPPIPRNCPPDFVALMTDCWAENADSRPSMETVLNKLEALEVTGWPDLAVPR